MISCRSASIQSLIGVVLAGFAIVTPAAGADPTRPQNVILIMTDNHGAWTLGCYGNKDVPTPNFDRLAIQPERLGNI